MKLGFKEVLLRKNVSFFGQNVTRPLLNTAMQPFTKFDHKNPANCWKISAAQ